MSVSVQKTPDIVIKNAMNFRFNKTEILKKINGKSGIYVFKCNDVPFYVGASKNLYTRAVRMYRKNEDRQPQLFKAMLSVFKKRIASIYVLSTEIFFYP